MIDNLELICSILDTRELVEDTFYSVEVIKRRKDNPDMDIASVKLLNREVTTSHHLRVIWEDLKAIADVTGSRIYINLNRKHNEAVMAEILMKCAVSVKTRGTARPTNLVNSAIGLTRNFDAEPYWLVDVDCPKAIDELALIETINDAEPRKVDNKIIAKIPTKNGYHLITTKFDSRIMSLFGDLDISVHKNNPTILYVSK